MCHKRLAQQRADRRRPPGSAKASGNGAARALDTARPPVDGSADVPPWERWLRTTDVAERLGVSAETVRRFIKQGHLRANVIALPDRLPMMRIRQADFDEFRRAHVKDTQHDDWEG